MTPLRWLLLQLAIVLAIAAGAVMWASALMGSFDTYHSPFRGRTIAPGEAIGTPLTRRLVFVYVDGLRTDTAANAQVMPYLNELRARGASAISHSREPSYSIPGYTTMMSGAWPEFNDGPLLNPDEAHLVTWPQDNLFRAAKRAGLKIGLADHYSAEKLIPQDTLAGHFYVHNEENEDDRAVTEAAVRWLKDGAYQFIVVHLDQVDHKSHSFGPHSPQGIEAARNADILLRELGGALDLTQDTIFVTSDHGHIEQGGHGGHEEIVTREPWIIAGAGVKPGQYPDTQMVDLSPTIAALLGTSLPALSQGHVRTDMLQLTDAQGAAIGAALQKQQLQWVYEYLTATGKPQLQLGASGDAVTDAQGAVQAERASQFAWAGLMRIAVIAIVVLAILAALWFSHERLHHWHVGAVLIYLTAFHIIYALILGRTYSLSSVLSSGDILSTGFGSAAIAFMIAAAIAVWQDGALRRGPIEAAREVLSVALATIVITGIPALMGYAVNGATIGAILPNFALMFFTFLTLLQLAAIAVVAVLLGALAAGIAYVLARNKPATPVLVTPSSAT